MMKSYHFLCLRDWSYLPILGLHNFEAAKEELPEATSEAPSLAPRPSK